MHNDYLKYWRVIRQYIKIKYNLTQSDLDILLFLKSESYFSKDKFEEFNEILSWDKQRFEKLRQRLPGIKRSDSRLCSVQEIGGLNGGVE